MPPFDLAGLDELDTPTLRKKYYETAQAGLDAASQPATPDQGSLLWQGIIPALAAAVLTKGKSLGFSGTPLLNVLDSANKRADENKKFSVESKLKGAGLYGDLLEKRETTEANTIARQDTLDERIRSDKANESLRGQQIDATRQAHEDSMANVSATRDATQAQRETTNQQAEERNKRGRDSLAQREETALTNRINSRIDREGLSTSKRSFDEFEAILNDPNKGLSAKITAAETLTRGLTGTGKAGQKLDFALAPMDFQGKFTTWTNAITGGAANVMSDAKEEDLRNLARVLKSGMANRLKEIILSEKKNPRPSSELVKRGEYDTVIQKAADTYGISVDDIPTLDPNKKYKSRGNGAILSGAEVMKRANPITFSSWDEVQ